MSNFQIILTETELVYFTLFMLVATLLLAARYYYGDNRFLKEYRLNKRINTSINPQFQNIIFKCVFDSKRTLYLISDNVLEITGYQSTAFVNNEIAFADIIHPEDLIKIRFSIENSMAQKRSYRVEYRIKTKWGIEKWFLEQGLCIKRDKQIMLEGIITDITEYKLSEEFHVESENRFRALIEKSPFAISISCNEIITYCNPLFLKMFAKKHPDVLGSNILDCFAPLEQHIVDGLLRRYQNGKCENYELETIGLCAEADFPVQVFFSSVEMGDFNGVLTTFIDITERKQAFSKLLSLNQRLNDIIDLIPDPTFVIDQNKYVLYWNRAMEELTGVKKKDVIGKGDGIYSKAFYGEKRSMMIDLIDVENDVIEKVYKYINKTNNKVYGEFTGLINNRKDPVSLWGVASPLYDNNGFRFGAIELIKDITEYSHTITKLKHAEKALQESEEKYRTITESITDYVFKLTYFRGRIKYFFQNSGIEKIIGYSIADFSTNPKLLYYIIDAEDKRSVLQVIKGIFSNKSNRTIEFRVTHKNGSKIWLSNTFIFSKEIDGGLDFNCVIKDITLRKRFEAALQDAEVRYRSVFDQSGLASTVCDLSGKIIMQNLLAANLLGGIPEDFIGKNLRDFWPKKDSIDSMIEILVHNHELVLDEKELKLPTGIYWFKIYIHAIRNDNSDIIGIQIILQDITEKKELNKKILNTIIDTEEKERLNFAQELHDGLGPIISAVKLYLQWLTKPDSGLSPYEILADTEKMVDEAAKTIKEISFKLSPHVLTNFGLVEAVTTFSNKIKITKNIEFSIFSNFTERIENTTEIILYRIICECINNTIKHADATLITIEMNKSLHNLELCYSDNGLGFDVETILDSKKGNGLFNILSRLQSINASFGIESSPGKGVRITINCSL